ncbi:asparaginase [Paenibacillus solisilvae]|uniref:Asparaginase n=1 Tax=Paenibacillus solisilvae TaxID=2486751 RepID=A0ABW0VYT0_9BACL
MDEILVEEYRGSLVENVHRGHICGVGEGGAVRYEVGDAASLTYMRSSGKPVQAIPAIMQGVDIAYALKEKEIAVMTGSHRAESFHVEALETLMSKIGIQEEQLVCLPAYPLGENAKNQLIAEGKPKRRIYHNCSGKHLGILSLCKHKGYSTDDYTEPDHPVQQQIVKVLSYLSEVPVDEIVIGTDGCGCPVYAIPLKSMAYVYLKLTCPELIEDAAIRETVRKISGWMSRNPEMVAGTDRICSTLLLDDNIFAKGGAKGVYCFGLKREKLGFAIKITDGSEEEWPLVVAAILEQIGYARQETIASLYRLAPVAIMNDNNRIVGRNQSVFKLRHT